MKGDCNICANGRLPVTSRTCVECGLSRKNYKPLTDADRIRSMTEDELAQAGGGRMIVFDGFELIGLAILVFLLLVCGIILVFDLIAYAVKKRRQKRIDEAFKEEGE